MQVLYLFENQISSIGDGLKDLTKITQLSLYDNRIMKIEGLESLVNLRKLYLEKNCIGKLEGLTNCQKLEELNVGY